MMPLFRSENDRKLCCKQRAWAANDSFFCYLRDSGYFELQKDTQELSKIFLRTFCLLEKNGRKSHRFEKKTVFDISIF
ncbi:hypothetical protein DZB91_11850 [Brevibacillus sp. VP]|nr:hypothetical protein DZB91_11850 [Brevibacillus sp. VP]